MRKPVQVAIVKAGELIAFCDDGSIWEFSGNAWSKFPDIPQDDPEPKPATNLEIVLVLRELAKAEEEFRSTYQEKEIFGAKLSLKWNLLRVAGDAARAVLKRIDEQE